MNDRAHKPGKYDVVIAGGGLVGGSFALMLAQRAPDLSILVIDAVATAPDSMPAAGTSDFDDRSTALSWGSRLIYQRAGVWPALAPHGCAITTIHVSDQGHFGATRLHSDELNVEALGYVVENRHLSAVINQALLAETGIATLAPATVQSFSPEKSGVTLSVALENNERLDVEAGLLVLADGGRSGLCKQAGIELQRQPYGQQALIANIAFEQPHQGLAFERFTATGPMAVLPLNDDAAAANRAALVWTLSDDEAQHIMGLPDDAFIAALQPRFGWRLGRITKAGARSLYPLALTLASEQIRPGLVLLGNVAHTLHPVAGQGLNLALRDAEALVDELAAAANAGHSPGDYGVLERYLNRQHGDQLGTVLFSDRITRLFSSRQPVLAAGRNLGLLLMDLLPPARQWFARQAMGLK